MKTTQNMYGKNEGQTQDHWKGVRVRLQMGGFLHFPVDLPGRRSQLQRFFHP